MPDEFFQIPLSKSFQATLPYRVFPPTDDQPFFRDLRKGMRKLEPDTRGNVPPGTAEFVVIGPDGKPLRDKDGHLPTNAWWIGFAPFDNPQIAVAVWVHDAGEGAAFAAPVARKIFARYFHVSDVRSPWGCDTLQSTPSYCAKYQDWLRQKIVFTDPIQRESKEEDFHDPAFPLPKDVPAP